jgi:hypothetical protein
VLTATLAALIWLRIVSSCDVTLTHSALPGQPGTPRLAAVMEVA